jgi:hypothetical protein
MSTALLTLAQSYAYSSQSHLPGAGEVVFPLLILLVVSGVIFVVALAIGLLIA